MLFVLTLLNLAYICYALNLAAISQQSVIALGLLFIGYIVLFTIILRKPEYSIYGFILVMFLVPSGGTDFVIFKIAKLPSATSVTINFLVQSVASMAICVNLISRRPRGQMVSLGKFRMFFYLIIASIFLQIIINSIYFSPDNPYGIMFEPQDFVGFGPLLFGVIFLLGCLSFFDDPQKLETVYAIFLLFGLVMSLEVIAYCILDLSLPFHDRVIHQTGRFNEFFLADYVKAGLLSGVAIGSALYFSFGRRKYWLLTIVPVLFLPIIFSYQRATLVMALLVILIFFLLLVFSRQFTQTIIFLGLVFALGVGVFSWGEGGVLKGTERIMTGAPRPVYFAGYLESGEARGGANLRAVDVLLCEPLGVGFMRAARFMSSMDIPSNFQISREYAAATAYYSRLTSGKHETTSHNFFLDLGVEYGLVAMAALLWLLYACLVNFRNFMRMVGRGYLKDRNLLLLSYANYAIFFGIVAYGLFQNTRLYPMFFFFAFVTFLTGKLPLLGRMPATRQERFKAAALPSASSLP